MSRKPARAALAPSPVSGSAKDGRGARTEIAFADQRLRGPLCGLCDPNLVLV